ALLEMDGLRLGEMRAASDNNGTVRKSFGDLVAYMFFHAVHFPGRQELAIRQLGETVFITADPCKPLHMTIPGRQVCIPDGPRYRKTVPRRALELEGTPTLGL